MEKETVSLYDISTSFEETGNSDRLDYSSILFTRTMSNYMFRNSNVREFITYLNSIFYTLIESVKILRVYRNFTVKKDYKKIN